MELTAKRRDELIDWFVDQVTKRGFTTPAIMFLEINRPLAFVASSAANFLAPVLGAALPPNLMEELGALLEDRKNFDLVIDRLEAAAIDYDREEKEYRAKVKAQREQRRLARQGTNTDPKNDAPQDGAPPEGTA